MVSTRLLKPLFFPPLEAKSFCLRVATKEKGMGINKIKRVWISLEKETDKKQETIRKLAFRSEKPHYLKNYLPTHNPLEELRSKGLKHPLYSWSWT